MAIDETAAARTSVVAATRLDRIRRAAVRRSTPSPRTGPTVRAKAPYFSRPNGGTNMYPWPRTVTIASVSSFLRSRATRVSIARSLASRLSAGASSISSLRVKMRVRPACEGTHQHHLAGSEPFRRLALEQQARRRQVDRRPLEPDQFAAPGAPALQDAADPCRQFLRVGRLDHEVVRTRLETRDPVHLIGVGRQHQHRTVETTTQARQSSRDRATRHVEVEHDEIE